MPRLYALAFVLIAAGSAQAAEKTLDKTFTVSPGGTLLVDADGADIHVAGNDSNQVVVHMVFRGSESDLAKMKIDAVQTSNGVSVTMKKEDRGWFSWGGWGGEQNIQVTVPRHYTVNAHTGGGGVELKDTEGAATLHTSGGDVSAKNVGGNVELKTSGGSIHADAIRGDVDADTSGGDVSAKNITGNAKLQTSGGSIQADTVQGDVDADTSGGDVRLLKVDGKIRGNSSGGSVRLSLVGANRGISATSSGGDIEMSLPRGTAARIDASTSGGEVTTDIPVTTTVVKEHALHGTFNGGGETIYAHTSGGSIRVHAEN